MKTSPSPGVGTGPGDDATTAQLAERSRQELHALRSALKARLTALEAALANPGSGESLERLMLDLARVATEEAESAARRAILQVQLELQAQAHAARADTENVQASLEAERSASAALRAALDAERARADALERQLADLDRRWCEADARATEAARGGEELVRQLAEARRERDALAAELETLRNEAATTVATEAARAAAPADVAEPAAVENPGGEGAPPVVAPTAFPGPARCASRQAFARDVPVQIDDAEGVLVDLSVTGAQVISLTALRPNRTVRLQLSSDAAVISCKGKIMWARLEPSRHGQPFRYRAGILFTSADEAAIAAFMARHGAAEPQAT